VKLYELKDMDGDIVALYWKPDINSAMILYMIESYGELPN